ncbi:hypothetical protein CWI36_1012p0010 [Hamiltosporidium magnivora]|uniref:Uncharacterized protein n=1 Tax=Hamiltosporidium magnivora TaxID=148818 RepID=A0A4Q9L5T3_9MICR|nr:hypothetical protein CWI36_1012p0010 [Hamiltosporidium magnivora]
MKFDFCSFYMNLFHKLLFLSILIFIKHSSERNVRFNIPYNYEESCSDILLKETKPKCWCQIQRSSIFDTNEVEYFENFTRKDKNVQYDEYVISDVEKLNLKFDTFYEFNDINSNLEIFLCDHIKKSEFLIFYEFLISYYLLNNKMTIDKFYTILYFLEYFRVKQDDELRNLIKMILYSLTISDDIKHFDLDEVSFHFSKQKCFSHELFKKISQ